jgi:hypothetical protein
MQKLPNVIRGIFSRVRRKLLMMLLLVLLLLLMMMMMLHTRNITSGSSMRKVTCGNSVGAAAVDCGQPDIGVGGLSRAAARGGASCTGTGGGEVRRWRVQGM